jgi:HK97 family phage portal protein
VRVNHGTALGQPAVWRAVNLLSGDVAKLPLVKFRRTSDNGKEADRGSAAYRIMRRKANSLMTAFTFRRTLTFHSLMHGNGCAFIYRDLAGRPLQLLILDPQQTCLAIVDGVAWYVTEVLGEQRKLPAADVLHIKGLSHDGLWGIDVVDLMAEALGLGMAAREFGSRFFGEGSNASGVLMVPGHFTQEKIRNTISSWNEMQTGLTKSHRIALLQDGVKWQQMTIPPEAAQMLGTREFEIREVANIWSVPPHKLGDGTRTSHNSLEQEDQAYLDESLDPHLVSWETECDFKLLDETEQESESHFFEFNRAARLRTDASTRATVYRVLTEIGVMSANDVLRRENMPTIGPAGDQHFRPANWMPLEDAALPPAAQAAARAHLQAALAERLARMARIETTRVAKAARGEQSAEGGVPEAWAAEFYAQFAVQLREALDPLVTAAWGILDPTGDAADALDLFVADYVRTRTHQAVAGELSEVDAEFVVERLLPLPPTHLEAA